MKKRQVQFIVAASALFFLIIIAVASNKTPQNVIWTDMEGYYVYLPATIIFDGFKKEAVRDTNYIQCWPGTNKIFTKYTCGVALLESPFFIAAHLLSRPLNFPSDGHSLIYCYSLMLAGIFYLLAGIFMLFNVSRKYYSLKASVFGVLGIFLGTNMYYYTLFQPSMSHIYSFFLFATLIWLTENGDFFKNKSFKYVLLGAVSGMIVLVRPTGIIVLVYPVYRWLKTTKSFKGFFEKNMISLILMILAFIIIWIPQMYYWKTITGNWFLWSYGDESFKYWKEPRLFRVLFDAWNGWILYSPIVLFPIFNIIYNRNTNLHFERAIIVVLSIATYVFASWWAWWFGGAFGHRCYVEYCALLALPFAASAEAFFKRPIVKYGFVLIYALLIYYNLGLTYHYQPPWDGESWTYNSVWREVVRIFTLN